MVRFAFTLPAKLPAALFTARLTTQLTTRLATLLPTAKLPNTLFTTLFMAISATLFALPALAAPSHIAVLLPQSDRMAKAAETIRDGFLAAYYADSQANKEAVTLDFYDSDSKNIIDLLHDIEQSNADLIIGPLDRERVDSVIAANATDIPVLALNSSDKSAQGVYQFSLSPEDELARLVAWMKAQGVTRPLVLLGNDANSQRQYQLFQSYWQSSQALPRVTLDSSRKGGLVASIKEMLQNSAQYDAFFLAAPQLASQVSPSLKYFKNRLPLYASSSAWTPVEDGSSQRDLEGLRFCDAPWILDDPQPEQASLYQAFNRPSSSYDRLYAFGADAWTLARNWERVQDGEPLSLRSGMIQPSRSGHLRRTPTCAEVRNGFATPLFSPDNDANGSASRERRSSFP